MSGTRGYRGYSGRTNKWRIFLALLLGLIILGAAAFLFVQESIYYDAGGQPHLRLPDFFSRDETPAEAQPPDGDVELILEPEPDPYRRGVDLISARPLTAALCEGLETQGAVAVTLKDGAGLMYYPSEYATKGSVRTEEDTPAALARLTGGETYSIARFNCLHDPISANYYVTARGVSNLKGYIYYDGNNSQWLDPSKPGTRAMLTDQLKEVAALGFDEIMLSELSCPNTGKLENSKFHDRKGTPRQFIRETLEALLEELKPYEVTVSLELPAAAILQSDEAAGLFLEDLAPLVPYIYAAAEPEQIPTLTEAVAKAAPECVFIALTETEAEGHFLLRR